MSDVAAELARRARASLADFIFAGWHVLEPTTRLTWNWHLEAMALHVQAVLDDWRARQRDPHALQRIQNLLINIPPGTLKSRVLVYAIPWIWLHVPSFRAICLSANPRVALRDSMYAREVVTSEWYQQAFSPKWRLADDANAKSYFATTAGGSRMALGWQAKITGDRGDALFVDDPHDAEEVHSTASRRSVLDRWDSAIANRVNDLRTSVRIGICQRVHEEDWSGHVLAQGGWCHLMLPMEYEPERACETVIGWRDPRKEPGEVLHPERFPPDVLAKEKLRLGSYGTAGQLQQRPAPTAGGLFPRAAWSFWRPEPGAVAVALDAALERTVQDTPTYHALTTQMQALREAEAAAARCPRPLGCDLDRPAVFLPTTFDQTVISVDCSFKDSATSDYVAAGVVSGKGALRFVREVHRKRLDFTNTCALVVDLAARYPGARVLVEAAANGHAIVNALQAKVSGIVAVPALGSKEARAAASSPQVEAHQVHLAEGAAWVGDFVEELSVFPRGKNDDQVDMLSMALNNMTGMSEVEAFMAMLTM